MLSLREVQTAFKHAMFADGTTDFVTGDDAAECFAIYRGTMMGSLTAALRISFPAVRKLVGDAFFDAMAEHFISENPPRQAYLNLYGDAFADFLADFEPAASLSYLSDVARLEWAVNIALHAPDHVPLTAAQLQYAMETEESPRFVPHPSVTLLTLVYPADAIWRAVLVDDDAVLAALDLASGPVHLCVARKAGAEVTRLASGSFQFAAALCAGEALETAMNATPIDAASELARHFTAGRFIAIHSGRDK